MLVGNYLSRWARVYAGIGAVECCGVALSLILRGSPVAYYLPGPEAAWSGGFFGSAAVLFAIACLYRTPRKCGMGVFGLGGSVHLMFAFGSAGYALDQGTGWILASLSAGIGGLYAATALKIAGPSH